MSFKIIGHRGAISLAPENTLSSLFILKNSDINYIEIDTILSMDNIPIIFHDKELDRVSNLKGEVIKYNFDDLKKADIGNMFSDKFKNERIPSLIEFISISNKLSINIFLELKSYYNDINDLQLVKEVVNRLNNINFEISIILCSYSRNIIKYLKKYGNKFKRSLIVDEIPDDYLEFLLENDCFSININYKPSNDINKIKNIINTLPNSFYIYCHVINEKKDLDELRNIGINGIITDIPIEILKY